MPSQLHEALLLLFRNRPALAPKLLTAALRQRMPQHTKVRIESAELNDIQPAEYRADLVMSLLDDVPSRGIVVEAQLSPDEVEALADPELAVLSAMAHGRDADSAKAAQIAVAAQSASQALDESRSKLYFDLVQDSLSEAARQEFQSMDPAKYEYQSEFAKRYLAQGRLEGTLEGRIDLIRRQLCRRFGELPPEVDARLSSASLEELDAIGERLLTARTLDDALG